MGPKTEQLVGVLNELIPLLSENDAAHWANWFRGAKSKIESSDFSGIERVLGAYGGMGSFSDLILGTSVKEGAVVHSPDYDQLNGVLDRLRTEAWQLAEDIRRDQFVRDAGERNVTE